MPVDQATIRYRKKEWQVRSGMTIRSAIEKGELDPLAVLALKEKRLVNDQTILESGDEIRLIDVISGG